MANQTAQGSANDYIQFSSLPHSGTIDVALCDTTPAKNKAIAIRCEGACVLTVITGSGSSRNVNFKDGERQDLEIRKVTAVVSGSPYPIGLYF